MLSDYPNCCDNCRKEYRQQRLNELYRMVSGDYSVPSSNSPSSHTVSKVLKAGSSLRPIIPATITKPKRIIMHPEKQRLNQERVRKRAELSRFIKGGAAPPKMELN